MPEEIRKSIRNVDGLSPLIHKTCSLQQDGLFSLKNNDDLPENSAESIRARKGVEPRLEAPGTVQTSLRNIMEEVWVAETDSQIPKTGPGTMTELQQPISEPSMESTVVVNYPAPMGLC